MISDRDLQYIHQAYILTKDPIMKHVRWTSGLVDRPDVDAKLLYLDISSLLSADTRISSRTVTPRQKNLRTLSRTLTGLIADIQDCHEDAEASVEAALDLANRAVFLSFQSPPYTQADLSIARDQADAVRALLLRPGIAEYERTRINAL